MVADKRQECTPGVYCCWGGSRGGEEGSGAGGEGGEGDQGFGGGEGRGE